MIFVILSLLLMTLGYGFAIWSTRVFPTLRPFRYNPATDAHLPEARQTTFHQTFIARHKLDVIIAGYQTDAEMINALSEWVFNLWLPQPGKLARSDNPLTIVSRAKNGERFARSEYTAVLANAMMAVGIPTRTVTLNTRDFHFRPFYSHYTGIEYFDREHFKWAWLDSQFGIRVLNNNRPLNVIELKEALLSKHLINLSPDFEDLDSSSYMAKLSPYLDIVIAQPLGQNRRFALIPPQLKIWKKKYLFGRSLYDVSCHSLLSFYASHPINQLTKPVKTQAINIHNKRAYIQP